MTMLRIGPDVLRHAAVDQDQALGQGLGEAASPRLPAWAESPAGSAGRAADGRAAAGPG